MSVFTTMLATTAATVETVAETLETVAAKAETVAAAETTAATEAALDVASIKEFMDGLDPAALLPNLNELFANLSGLCRAAVMIGPAVMLILGLLYLFLAPKEANYYFGYRCYYGMGSVNAWQFTQRMAGALLSLTGLILGIVMFVISAGFAKMDPMAMAWKSIRCLVWEAALAFAVTLLINFLAMHFFDRRGEYRRKPKKKE